MNNNFDRLTEKLSRVKFLAGSTVEQRREILPPVKLLEDKYIANCRLVKNREEMLKYMPKNAVCAEIGILEGAFSAKILEITQPEKLHLIDIDAAAIENANRKFALDVSNGRVVMDLGDSSEIIMSMPDNYFDWVYIDGDHSYEAVKKDLNATRLKLKPDGLIAMNDYIYFMPLTLSKCGVIEAVNEFCMEYDFELIYFAFQGRMYNDVVLRNI